MTSYRQREQRGDVSCGSGLSQVLQHWHSQSALSFVVAFGALTPALLAALSGHGAPVEVLGMWLVVLSLVLLALPIIAIALHSRDRARFG